LIRRRDWRREAQVAARGREVPTPRRHFQGAGRAGPRDERPTGRQSPEPGASGSVRVHRRTRQRRGL